MTDEEKKAINNFKKLDFFEYDWQIGDEDFETREDMLSYSEKMKETILNLIEKYQKEIDEKNIAINKMSKDISRQLEEIEEKSTIRMAGAEKVKQLEKGNRSLMESRKKWKNRYYKEKAKNKECISKDKIREKIKKYDKWILEGGDYTESLEAQRYALKELLEEK